MVSVWYVTEQVEWRLRAELAIPFGVVQFVREAALCGQL